MERASTEEEKKEVHFGGQLSSGTEMMDADQAGLKRKREEDDESTSGGNPSKRPRLEEMIECVVEASSTPTREEIIQKRLARFERQGEPVLSPMASTPPPPVTPTWCTPTPKAAPAAELVGDLMPSVPVMLQLSPAPVPEPATETDAKWEGHALQRIFDVIIVPDVESNRKTPKGPVLLEELAAEFAQITGGNFPSGADLDRVLLARLQLTSADLPEYAQQTRFQYLLQCYRYIAVERSSIQGIATRGTFLDEARRLVLFYASLALDSPEFFPEEEERGQLYSLLKQPVGLPHGFFDALVSQNKDTPETLDRIVGEVFSLLWREIASAAVSVDREEDYLPLQKLFKELINNEAVAARVIKQDNWLPPLGDQGRSLELQSFLGPFVRPSVLPDESLASTQIVMRHYSGPKESWKDGTRLLRARLATVQANATDIVKKLLMHKGEASVCRDAVLNWLAAVVNASVARTRMQADAFATTSCGFLLNLSVTLMHICAPFLPGKILSVDPAFPSRTRRLAFAGETRLMMSAGEASAWADALPPPAERYNKHMTEYFFVALRCLHVGFVQTLNRCKELKRTTQRLADDQRWINDSRDEWAQTAQEPQQLMHLREIENQLRELERVQRVYDVQLAKPDYVQSVLAFYSSVASWLLALYDPAAKGPPYADVPKVVAALPEHIVEDLITALHHALARTPKEFDAIMTREPLISLVVSLIGAGNILRRHTRARLISTLVLMIPNNRNCAFEGKTFELNSLACRVLPASLMAFYVEVETEGGPFVDKLGVRYHIGQLLDYMWMTQPHLKQGIIAESRDQERFVHFVNTLLNDATYTFDEALAKLAKIRAVQTDMAQVGSWLALPSAERRQREEELAEAEEMAPSFLALAGASMRMLEYMSADIVEPFMSPMLVGRVAAMLNALATTLVGEKVASIKVDNPEKYNFRPMQILRDVARVYAHLASGKAFQEAVGADERSYRPELLPRIAAVAHDKALLTQNDVEMLRRLANDAAAAVERGRRVREAMEREQPPDEFLDPLTMEVMTDPVDTPSGRVYDRASIHRHILNFHNDPFTKAKLELEDLVPALELKARIQAYVRDVRAKHGL